MKRFLVVLLSLHIFFCCFASVVISESGGWLESAYAEWSSTENYSDYNAYICKENGSYQLLDKPLLRCYGNYYRADALGLPAGNYQMKIVPVSDNNELESEAVETPLLQVAAHDRNGFAHFTWKNGVGAYTDAGSLKSGVKVLYIHVGNAKTITTDVVTSNKGAVTHCVGLQHIISAYEKGQDTTPLCIRIIGTIDVNDLDSLGSKEEGLQIKGRKADTELNFTIEGVGKDALLRGFGILVRNCKSVEIRNLAVMTAMDDCISLDTDNSNIWVHHIDGFYGTQGGGDHEKGDGTIDVKSDSKYVTIDYCHFWDTGKSTMCGMKSESGPNYITYHHNWFDHSDSRHPRIRTMSVHIYNNWFDGNSKYGVGVTTGACAFVENNYFRSCAKPMLISMQGTDTKNGKAEADGTFSKEDGGIIKAYNNIITGSKTLVYYDASNSPVHFDAYLAANRNDIVPQDVKSKAGNYTYNNFDTDPALMPVITPDAPADIPVLLAGEHGAGRMQHGDVTFSFSDSDDSSSGLNSALVALIANYKSPLVSILGEDYNVVINSIEDNHIDTSLSFDGHVLLNPEGSLLRLFTTAGVCLGSTTRKLIDTDALPRGLYIAQTHSGVLKFYK